jgi:hypothetical protein
MGEKRVLIRQRHAAVALVKITQEAANEAQGKTEATQNGQQRRAILNAGWPMALGSGDFSRLWSKITWEKKGAFRTGAAPFLLTTCKMATCNTRTRTNYKQRLRVDPPCV